MNKIEILNSEFIKARKEKNSIAIALFSTLRGELDTAVKKGSPADDSTLEKLAKKMSENAKTINSEESLIELELLKQFMPTMLSEEEIRLIVQESVSSNPDKANNFKLGNKGAFVGIVMKQVSGKADVKIVNNIIETVLAD